MNLGLYCHFEAKFEETGEVLLPSYLGRFLSELASQCGRMTLYVHSNDQLEIDDFPLREPLVHAVDMGPLRSFPARTFRPWVDVRRFRQNLAGVDLVLICGPSALLPYLVRACGSIPVALFLAADYGTGSPASHMPRWRRMLIEVWRNLYVFQQRRAVRRVDLVLVNSPALTPPIRKLTQNVDEVVWSVLSDDTIANEPVPSSGDDQLLSRRVRAIYVGRIVEEKGLLEAVESIEMLVTRGLDIVLDLVGWVDDARFIADLQSEIRGRDIENRFRFRGYIPEGPELFHAYRCADLFVLPSRDEGFPLALIGAMGAGLPAIATRVGGIPGMVEDGTSAVLVDPRSPRALADAVELIVRDTELRSRVAREGLRWARELTLERSCALICRHLGRLVRDGKV